MRSKHEGRISASQKVQKSWIWSLTVLVGWGYTPLTNEAGGASSECWGSPLSWFQIQSGA